MPYSFMQARTVLYAPGHRPDRFTKATSYNPDDIVLDLEDSVGENSKKFARNNVYQWLCAGGVGAVRINSIDTPWYDNDIAMLHDFPRAVLLPKVTSASDVMDLAAKLPETATVVPIIETASAVVNCFDICTAPHVGRVIFGSADLAKDLGVERTNHVALNFARSRLVIASAAGKLPPPLDGACTSISDLASVAEEASNAASLGFTGKSCIHPSQIPVVSAAFAPKADDLQWASAVVSAARKDGCAVRVDGQLVAKPMIERARRLLAQHGGPALAASRSPHTRE